MADMVCETCLGTCQRVESAFAFCEQCQHWSSNRSYRDCKPVYESVDYVLVNQRSLGSFDRLKKEWATNIDILKRHIATGRALDIGFLEGAGMSALADAGFAAWGFDVTDTARVTAEANGIAADRLIVGVEFAAELTQFKFDVIMVREVIEHVPDPVGLLDQIRESIKPTGIVQVQTPRYHPDQRGWDNSLHLRIYSTSSLLREMELSGFECCDLLQWHGGVCVTARPV